MSERRYLHAGVSNPNSRLDEAGVLGIRAGVKDGVSVHDLSKFYGVSVVTIYKVVSGERWGHVGNITRR